VPSAPPLPTIPLQSTRSSPAAVVAGRCDYYVVHSSSDSPHIKAAAISEWARRWTEREGRSPTVYIDEACGDPALTPAERVAHLPFYLARSRRLLVLAGPTLTAQLSAVIELYTWRVMAGALDDTEVLPLATSGPLADRIVASFDAFHARHATASSHRADAAEENALFVRALELASVTTINEVVRSYLGRLNESLDRAKRAAVGMAGTAAPSASAVRPS
jgi:hypothetical protein